MYKFLKTMIKISVSLMIVGSILAVGLYYHFVISHPGAHLKEENIKKAISPESPVFYVDGQNKIGIFFEQSHREYVEFKNIPKNFINALLAAEDKDFYTHSGFSFYRILKAVYTNIVSGRIVQGASTITQQTAKNIFNKYFNRNERTYFVKIKELIDALCLEAYFSKDKILEFYSNQFHVSGNGRGLGIAAQYFFSKNVKDLSLLEAAFIAGSVKAPFNYTPFEQKKEKDKLKVLKRAFDRKNYVISRMYKLKMVSEKDYRELIKQEIPFKPGKFRYDFNVIMDLVKETLNSEKYKEILAKNNIDNISTSGIKIITTLDKNIQEASLFAMRKTLSQLEIQLNGIKGDFEQAANIEFEDKEVIPSEFFKGVVAAVNIPKDFKKHYKETSIEVFFGNSRKGLIKYPEIKETLSFYKQYKNGKWAVIGNDEILSLLTKLKPGNPITVCIKSIDGDHVDLSWEEEPGLNGGALVMDKGKVVAMVGGYENSGYNRAITAKRQPGSIFKPVLFQAAFQLNWTPLDLLDNYRKIFTYQGSVYFPQPDHEPHSDEVSVLWATAYSENLATIDLLHKICDKLSFDEFKELANFVGLAKNKWGAESDSQYKSRIIKEGIILNRENLKEKLFDLIKQEKITDLSFSDNVSQIPKIKLMRYGFGFNEKMRELKNEVIELWYTLLGFNAPKGKKLTNMELLREIEEKYIEIDMIEDNYIYVEDFFAEYSKKNETLKNLMTSIKVKADSEGKIPSFTELEGSISASLAKVASNFFYKGETGFPEANPLFFVSDKKLEEMRSFEELKNSLKIKISGNAELTTLLDKHPANFQVLHGLKQVTSEELFLFLTQKMNSETIPDFILSDKKLFFENKISVDVFTELKQKLEERSAEQIKDTEYTMENLYLSRDFNILLGLRYISKLLKKIGVASEIEEVLSLPLGSNALTLLETLKIYQTYMDGKLYVSENNDIDLIEKILLPNDEVIYSRTDFEKKIIIPEISYGTSLILKSVFDVGTAQSVSKDLILSSKDQKEKKKIEAYKIKVPAFGKTGTTNDYTNSVFIGLLPYFTEFGETLKFNNSYVIGCYIGYDDNRRMVNKSIRISGSSGALPCWTTIAKEIIKNKEYHKKVDLADYAFKNDKELKVEKLSKPYYIPISLKSGLQLESQWFSSYPETVEKESRIIEVEGKEENETFTFKRYFTLFSD